MPPSNITANIFTSLCFHAICPFYNYYYTSNLVLLIFLFIFSSSSHFVHEEMRDRMERLVVLPFSMGCSSQSSVAVIETNPKKPKPEPQSSSPPAEAVLQGEESLSGANCKNSSLGLLPLPKPNFGIQRLMKSFKNFSQLFVYKEEVEEMEMEIGFPTDVKHVTHIGWDGSANTNPLKGWESLRGPELLSLPSLSLRQFELAMAAQSNNTPLVLGSSKA